MKILFTLFASFALSLSAQVADWENYVVPAEGYIKDSGTDNGFESDGIFVENIYTDAPPNSYWSGWIVSNGTDTEQPGFTNEHSVYAGSGAEGSENFLVSYIFGEGIIKFNNYPRNRGFVGMRVTNNTYAYLSMKNGDSVAKKFGGESGNDPDYFLLTIRGYEGGALSDEKIEFYLADFRFDDEAQDYIVDDWQYIDLTPFQESDSLSLTLSSSDVGSFGMNTPAYVCVDNIESYILSSTSDLNSIQKVDFEFFGNEMLFDLKENTRIAIYDLSGKLVMSKSFAKGHHFLSTMDYPSGAYFVQFASKRHRESHQIVIQN